MTCLIVFVIARPRS